MSVKSLKNRNSNYRINAIIKKVFKIVLGQWLLGSGWQKKIVEKVLPKDVPPNSRGFQMGLAIPTRKFTKIILILWSTGKW
jgi:hypothetical protein